MQLPSRRSTFNVRIVLKTLPGPVARLLRPAVEVERLVKHREVVISHQRRPASAGNKVKTLHWIRPIADHIAKADDVLDAAALDFFQNNRERFEIRVDVRDDGEHYIVRRTVAPARVAG
jgi:hypothetical protein